MTWASTTYKALWNNQLTVKQETESTPEDTRELLNEQWVQ